MGVEGPHQAELAVIRGQWTSGGISTQTSKSLKRLHALLLVQERRYTLSLRHISSGIKPSINIIKWDPAFIIPDHIPSWTSYPYKEEWRDIVTRGVQPGCTSDFPKQTNPPPNHGSALRALNAVIKSIRKGQDEGRYLTLDNDLLSSLEGVTCSPFGAVQKGDVDVALDTRVIHDLSFPKGQSVNDQTQEWSTVAVPYDGAAQLAHRILQVENVFPGLVRMSTGDVTGAFRNIPLAAEAAGRFAGTIPELGILLLQDIIGLLEVQSFTCTSAQFQNGLNNQSLVWQHLMEKHGAMTTYAMSQILDHA
ncbi:LOW QUALITY PROTEIN: Cleavage induced Predicted protein [Phytophthora palmivora]|uniref:Uncharacterized protein n=1 Tax=Phytophthora palmivora TaxID=4796 RepID=A0A2P4YGH1_9STRA|nr:LOW QUALITY PROTEIN: Cleavage induced Predicted protein [Phytophthora palmivora]